MPGQERNLSRRESFRSSTRIGRAESAPDFLQTCLTPSRYLAHGLQMMSAYLQQLAPSTYVGNCAAFQTGDQLRRVQRVAYRTKQLDRTYPERLFGKTERIAWEQRPEWQGLRKGVERLLVTFDWDDVFVGLNLVVKPLADELTLRQFATVARHLECRARCAGRRQSVSRCRTQPPMDRCAHSVCNRGRRGQSRTSPMRWSPNGARWRTKSWKLEATCWDPSPAGPCSADRIAAAAADAWRSFLDGAGLQTESEEGFNGIRIRQPNRCAEPAWRSWVIVPGARHFCLFFDTKSRSARNSGALFQDGPRAITNSAFGCSPTRSPKTMQVRARSGDSRRGSTLGRSANGVHVRRGMLSQRWGVRSESSDKRVGCTSQRRTLGRLRRASE